MNINHTHPSTAIMLLSARCVSCMNSTPLDKCQKYSFVGSVSTGRLTGFTDQAAHLRGNGAEVRRADERQIARAG